LRCIRGVMFGLARSIRVVWYIAATTATLVSACNIFGPRSCDYTHGVHLKKTGRYHKLTSECLAL